MRKSADDLAEGGRNLTGKEGRISGRSSTIKRIEVGGNTANGDCE